MLTRNLKNPFPFVGYFGPEYFCDREKEAAQIIRNLENGGSTTLISIRRMGKTGLIQHVFGQLPHGYKGIYVDILSTEDLKQLLNLLATSIIRSISEKSSIGKKIWDFIKSLRPVISFDALTGEPQASFNLEKNDAIPGIQAVLSFLDRQQFKTVIALDEFQQILKYPDKNSEAWFRSAIQQLKQVQFIFSGSQQHLMADIFASPDRPFFRSTLMLYINPIDSNIYSAFIEKVFSKYGKTIKSEIVYEILNWCNLHTYYVQLLCNRVFSGSSGKEITEQIWKSQADELLREQEPVFINYRNLLTRPQWQLLKALAFSDKVYMPTSKDFIHDYNLGSSASVLRSLQSLQKYEFVFSDYDQQGLKYYCVYDVFFRQWIREKLY
jgi:uncharacterized protein